MNLEKIFAKDLAGDLRQETADKIRELRKQPEKITELKSDDETLKNYDSWHDLQEKIITAKKAIFGKIFKTEKYKELIIEIEQNLKLKKEVDINLVKNEYSKKFDDILKDCPLSEEERKKYLSTEVMEEMSLEDYLVLLKRLSGEAFYHVTRYGVRENTFESTGGGHSSGEGELVNGFTPLLEAGNINSFTSTVIKDSEQLAKSIRSDVVAELKKAGKTTEEVVDIIMSSFDTGYFLDRESAHFSYGQNLHHMYGAENDYKLYFYYPVEYILQNDFFNKTRESAINIGRGYYNNSYGIKQTYNDFEIFNFGKGVPINAGILCITGDVRVDPKTGSQYLLKNGKPETDTNGDFKRPADTISSQEYWEKYFVDNPEKKPNKIIYGDFYTDSFTENLDLERLAKQNNLYNQSEEKSLEFKEYQQSTRKMIVRIVNNVVEKEFEK